MQSTLTQEVIPRNRCESGRNRTLFPGALAEHLGYA